VSVVAIFSDRIPIKLAPLAFVAGIRVAYPVVVLPEISTPIATPSDIAVLAFMAIFLNSHPVDEMGTKYVVVLGVLIGVTDCMFILLIIKKYLSFLYFLLLNLGFFHLQI
jgi:hypothetical protein